MVLVVQVMPTPGSLSRKQFHLNLNLNLNLNLLLNLNGKKMTTTCASSENPSLPTENFSFGGEKTALRPTHEKTALRPTGDVRWGHRLGE